MSKLNTRSIGKGAEGGCVEGMRGLSIEQCSDVFEGLSFHLGQAPAARADRRNKDHMDRASTLEDDALRARDALRVAKRAHASGQHGAALNFARQSLKLFPTSEAQALLDRISKAAAQRAEASHSEEDDEDDEDDYRAPRRSRGTSKGSGADERTVGCRLKKSLCSENCITEGKRS